jgi:hypothetical protein
VNFNLSEDDRILASAALLDYGDKHRHDGLEYEHDGQTTTVWQACVKLSAILNGHRPAPSIPNMSERIGRLFKSLEEAE